MSSFRILVAEDHPIFRLGLCSLLRSRGGWEVCGEAIDGTEAVDKCKQLRPDLVILDICLPKRNGVDVASRILKDNPQQRILVLTAVNSEQVILDCLEAGIRGWVFKSDRAEDLITAVEALQRHKSIFSSRVSDLAAESYSRFRVDPTVTTVPKLSPREREVVQLVAEGKSSKEIALMLNMAIKTVDTHRSNVLRKLKLHSVAELVLYAVRNEIIHLPRTNVLRFPENGNGLAMAASQRLN